MNSSKNEVKPKEDIIPPKKKYNANVDRIT